MELITVRVCFEFECYKCSLNIKCILQIQWDEIKLEMMITLVPVLLLVKQHFIPKLCR